MAKRASGVKSVEVFDDVRVGENYMVRTVTDHFVGTVRLVTTEVVVLEPCVWVADSGRLSAAMAQGLEKQPQSELEVIPGPVIVKQQSVVSIFQYRHKVPTATK